MFHHTVKQRLLSKSIQSDELMMDMNARFCFYFEDRVAKFFKNPTML